MLARRTAAVVAALCSLAATGGTGGPDEEREVTRLRAGEPGQIALSAPLDELVAGDVVDLTVSNGIPDAIGSVRQCVRTIDALADCTNRYPVQFDGRGHARFQYQLADPGRCGPAGSCVLVVDDPGPQRRAVVATIFGAPTPPPPLVTVTPAQLVEPGAEVRVDVTGLVPGTPVDVGYCDPACVSSARAIADDDGVAQVAITVGEPCPRCGIAVGGVTNTLTPVEFAPPAQTTYRPGRLVGGFVVAAVALIVAWRIVVTVDWRPPSEAATPDLDAAEL